MGNAQWQLETVTATESYREHCEDRVAVFSGDDRTVIVVADGAGGTGSGDVAAEAIIREIKREFGGIKSGEHWAELLRQIDCRIPAGESTAVVVDVRSYGIAGASVGDSQAWIVDEGRVIDLTDQQNRKPLLGTQCAEPVAFIHEPLQGLLLIATDGFCNYAKRDAVAQMIAHADFYAIPRNCIELVRLPSGDLWDDIGIVAARKKPIQRTRERYSI